MGRAFTGTLGLAVCGVILAVQVACTEEDGAVSTVTPIEVENISQLSALPGDTIAIKTIGAPCIENACSVRFGDTNIPFRTSESAVREDITFPTTPLPQASAQFPQRPGILPPGEGDGSIRFRARTGTTTTGSGIVLDSSQRIDSETVLDPSQRIDPEEVARKRRTADRPVSREEVRNSRTIRLPSGVLVPRQKPLDAETTEAGAALEEDRLLLITIPQIPFDLCPDQHVTARGCNVRVVIENVASEVTLFIEVINPDTDLAVPAENFFPEDDGLPEDD